MNQLLSPTHPYCILSFHPYLHCILSLRFSASAQGLLLLLILPVAAVNYLQHQDFVGTNIMTKNLDCTFTYMLYCTIKWSLAGVKHTTRMTLGLKYNFYKHMRTFERINFSYLELIYL